MYNYSWPEYGPFSNILKKIPVKNDFLVVYFLVVCEVVSNKCLTSCQNSFYQKWWMHLQWCTEGCAPLLTDGLRRIGSKRWQQSSSFYYNSTIPATSKPTGCDATLLQVLNESPLGSCVAWTCHLCRLARLATDLSLSSVHYQQNPEHWGEPLQQTPIFFIDSGNFEARIKAAQCQEQPDSEM